MTALHRLPDWPARLHAFLAEAQGRTYALGTWDCAIFAAEGVAAITGRRPLDLRGRYRSAFGMARTLALHGGDWRVAIGNALGRDAVPVRQARRGDVLLRVDDAGAGHIALCDGSYALAPATVGLFRRELPEFAQAWRVG